MIKKGKKVVLLTTVLSVLSANVPAVAVYADDDIKSGEPPALDQNGADLISHTNSIALATQTDSGMEHWLNPDNLSIQKDTDSLADSGENDGLGREDSGQDNPDTDNSNQDNILISNNPNEDSSLLPEDSGSNDNLNSANQNGSDSLLSENGNGNSGTNNQASNGLPYFNMGEHDADVNSSPVIPETNGDLNTEEPAADADSVYKISADIDPEASVPLQKSALAPMANTEILSGTGCSFNKTTGVLTITDETAFEQYDYDTQKWQNSLPIDKNSIKEIRLENTITQIPTSAFSGCSYLEKITFSSKLSSIGKKAFSGCSSLKDLIIPESVKKIESEAFSGCTSLQGVTFQGKTAPTGSETEHGSNMYYPFGSNMEKLPVYVPYAPYNPNDSTGYDIQLASWYTLWYLPELQPRISGDTAYFQISSFHTYKDFFSSGNAQRNIEYFFRLQKKDDATGNWKDFGNQECLSKQKDEQHAFYVVDEAKLTCKLGLASLADGIYRCIVDALCHGSIWNGMSYTLTSYEFDWNKSIAKPFSPDSADSENPSPYPSQKDDGFDYSQKGDESDSDIKDGGANSDGKDDNTNPDPNAGGSDSNQNSGTTIGSVSVGSSQTLGGWNYSSGYGHGNTASTVSSGNGSHSNNNASKSTLSDPAKSGNEDIILKDKAEKSDASSDTIGTSAKGINLFKGQANIILVSFISVLFIARILMLIIKRRKIDTL